MEVTKERKKWETKEKEWKKEKKEFKATINKLVEEKGGLERKVEEEATKAAKQIDEVRKEKGTLCKCSHDEKN